jgi:pyrimidine and pyridine-specific 5'-nucleotidase
MVLQCATKSLILHMQWQEGDTKFFGDQDANYVESGVPISLSASVNQPSSRLRNISTLSRSTSTMPNPQRRHSLARSTSNASSITKGRLSVNSPRTPTTPISASPHTGTSGSLPFAVRFGRAAILTAPPKLVAVVETPDVAVGAVDPRKRRVVTATRFSSRAGADRRVRMTSNMTPCYLPE